MFYISDMSLHYRIIIIIVARSSDSESEATIIFYRCSFINLFLLSKHFLRRRKTDIPETFPHDVA